MTRTIRKWLSGTTLDNASGAEKKRGVRLIIESLEARDVPAVYPADFIMGFGQATVGSVSASAMPVEDSSIVGSMPYILPPLSEGTSSVAYSSMPYILLPLSEGTSSVAYNSMPYILPPLSEGTSSVAYSSMPYILPPLSEGTSSVAYNSMPYSLPPLSESTTSVATSPTAYILPPLPTNASVAPSSMPYTFTPQPVTTTPLAFAPMPYTSASLPNPTSSIAPSLTPQNMPPLSADTTSGTSFAPTTSTYNIAQVAPKATPPGFKTIEEVTAELKKDATAAGILKAFEAAGGKLKTGPTAFGAHIITSTKKDGTVVKVEIVLDPDGTKNEDVSKAVASLLFELLRAEGNKTQIEYDKKLKAGTLTPKEFTLQSEELTYEYAKKHHEIAAAAVKGEIWKANSDEYINTIAKYPTWKDYAKDVESTEHYKELLKRAELKAPKPKNESPEPTLIPAESDDDSGIDSIAYFDAVPLFA